MSGVGNVLNVSFSPSIKKISDSAFKYWSGLRGIYIPETVDYIGKEAFYNAYKV